MFFNITQPNYSYVAQKFYYYVVLLPPAFFVTLSTNFKIVHFINLSMNLNYSFLSKFLVFWTNGNLVFPFFLLLLSLLALIALLHLNIRVNFLVFLAPLLLLLLSLNYLILPLAHHLMVPSYFQYHLSLFNNLLINRLNYIHPPLLYFVNASLIIFTCVLNLNYILNNNYLFLKSSLLLLATTTATLLTAVITIILGGWWALQEGTWGGWWAWDPSELLSLTALITLLYLSHVNFLVFNTLKVYKTLALALAILFLNYIFLQINFTLTSHNFGNSLNFFKINFFLNDAFFAFITLTVYLAGSGNYSLYPVLTNINFIPLLTTVLYVYLYSNYDLMNYFLWSVFRVELAIPLLNLQSVLLCTYFYLAVFYTYNFLFVFELAIVNYTFLFTPLIARFIYNFKTYFLHWSIINIFLLVTLDNPYSLNSSRANYFSYQLSSSINLTLLETIFNVSINSPPHTLVVIESFTFNFFVVNNLIQVFNNMAIVLYFVLNHVNFYLLNLLVLNLSKNFFLILVFLLTFLLVLMSRCKIVF